MMTPFDTSKLWIGGEWVPSSDGRTLPIENPSTGLTVGAIGRATPDDVDAAVSAAESALSGAWGALTAFERGRLLNRLSDLVLAHKELLTELEVTDVGKPVSQARADVVALARYLEFYAGAADKLHGQTIPFLADYTVYTLREPHGVTAHIIPWNYPMQIIGRSVVGALAAGNAVVVKPAEQASLTSLAFGWLCEQAGFPAGAINIVPGVGAEAGAALSGHPRIGHVSFTGSFDVGVQIQSAAARHAVPVTLELGGKSPQILFDDADLETALPVLVRAGLQNAGQTCSASSRILVHRRLHDHVVEAMSSIYRTLRVGPASADLELGPLISAAQKNRVERYLAAARATGAQQVAIGRIVDEAPEGGHYVAPQLYTHVNPQEPLAQEEIFGPVQVILPFDDEEEAVRLANGTPYGLVAGVWTRDAGRQHRLVRRLKAGQVFLNDYGAAGGVELPFGGTGHSGHGREKGFEALYGFTKLKTVAARHR